MLQTEKGPNRFAPPQSPPFPRGGSHVDRVPDDLAVLTLNPPRYHGGEAMGIKLADPIDYPALP